MILDIEQLKDSKNNSLSYEINTIIAEVGNNKPIVGNLTAYLTPLGIEIKGNLQTTVERLCDRCLASFDQEINTVIDEKYIFGSLFSEGMKDIELSPDNLVEELGDATTINLADLIYQTITLQTSDRIICSDDCPGTVQFESQEDEIDPRLEIFRKLSENKE